MVPGERLGEWQVVGTLGKGAQGEVHHCTRSAGSPREAAVKVLHAVEPEAVMRFTLEASRIQGLDHPCIVRVLGLGAQNGDTPWMAMELIHGRTLAAELEAAGGRLTETRSRFIVARIASALAFAHARGIWHRDVKPANVLLAGADRVVLVDFGIAKMALSDRLTITGMAVGTPRFMAPEVMRGTVRDAEAADVFSLCVLLHDLFGGDTLPGGLKALPADVADLVRRGTAVEPEVRPRLTEIARLDPRLPAELRPRARSDSTVHVPDAPKPRQRSLGAFAAVAGCLLALTGGPALAAVAWWTLVADTEPAPLEGTVDPPSNSTADSPQPGSEHEARTSPSGPEHAAASAPTSVEALRGGTTPGDAVPPALPSTATHSRFDDPNFAATAPREDLEAALAEAERQKVEYNPDNATAAAVVERMPTLDSCETARRYLPVVYTADSERVKDERLRSCELCLAQFRPHETANGDCSDDERYAELNGYCVHELTRFCPPSMIARLAQ